MSMEFRLVAHWNRVLRERSRLDYSHFSNKLCWDLDWLAAKFPGKKRGRVFQRALSGSHSVSRSTDQLQYGYPGP
jgi:hypothetical protein